MDKLDFLTSNRFWAMVITSASAVLIDPSFATQPWYITLGKFLGLVGAGFVTVRTLDRASEKIGGSANTTTVTMPKNVSSVKASKTTKKA